MIPANTQLGLRRCPVDFDEVGVVADGERHQQQQEFVLFLFSLQAGQFPLLFPPALQRRRGRTRRRKYASKGADNRHRSISLGRTKPLTLKNKESRCPVTTLPISKNRAKT